MKRFYRLGLLLCLLLCLCGATQADQAFSLPKAQVVTAFPDQWTVVTQETASTHARLLDVAPEIAAQFMESEGIVVAAYAPGEPVCMRIRMREDEQTRLYFDIERYTTVMRRDMRAEYLDTALWKLTGYRFQEAEWKNKSTTGRYLRLTFNRREGETIVSRGLMAITVRNGRLVTLEIEVEGRRLTNAEAKAFEAMVNATFYTPQLEMPLLPTGLELTAPAPEEVNALSFTLRGKTKPGATVRALLQVTDQEPYTVGETVAKASGAFTLSIALTEEGAWNLHIESALEGFETTRLTSRLTCDSKNIPVNLTEPLSGEVWNAQPLLAGKTLTGVTLTVEEDESQIVRKVNADGSFSIKLDPEIEGPRDLTVTASKQGYPDRVIVYSFERRWHPQDYESYLSGKLQRLSYANLLANPAKYTGRLVRFSGMVLDVSQSERLVYVRLAVTQDKDGQWRDELIFVTQEDTLLAPDDLVQCYGVVTGATYPIPLPDTQDEEGRVVNLPALDLLLSTMQ